MTESIDEALNKIPGLKENVAQRGAVPKPVDYFAEPEATGEGSEDSPLNAPRPKVEDSDAVQAALSQIPGLKDRMGK